MNEKMATTPFSRLYTNMIKLQVLTVYAYKAQFPLFQLSQRIGVVCLCELLLRFTGFHRQPFISSICEVFLQLEVCTSGSASGIKLQNCLLTLLGFIWSTENLFCILCPRFSQFAVAEYRGTILACSRKSSTCTHAGFACECWYCL